jgi:2-polyprenyl-3-methyl-5-hydroxy-6-metoxy-1,4-benzoquinol methylase
MAISFRPRRPASGTSWAWTLDPQAIINCANRGVEARCGGVEQFDSKERVFDAITLSHVIEGVHDQVATLKSCWRLLKPGGYLWIETPNIYSYGHSRYGGNWRGLEPQRHLALFNWRSLVHWLVRQVLATSNENRSETRSST